jgi:hypothetical protein
MLVIFKPETGVIEQVVHHGCFDLLEPKYRELGHGTLMVNEDLDILAYYVVNGKMTPRPEIVVSATTTQVPADGATEAVITFGPPIAEVIVTFQSQQVANERVTDGVIHFSATHIGDYAIQINPAFPYLGGTITMKAI